MVGLVVVSHSRALAEAAVSLATEMVRGTRPPIAIAAGAGNAFGTDAVRVKEAIEQVDGPDGVVVLLDLGSAVLAAEMAVELLDGSIRQRVVVSPAPLVEGLVAAVVAAAGGGSAAEVAAEADAGLVGKQSHLGPGIEAGPRSTAAPAGSGVVRETFTIANAHGLHARPAARVVGAVRGLEAQVLLADLTGGGAPVPAWSLSRIATLGARQGHQIEVSATGRLAREAVDRIVALAARNFDEVDVPVPPTPATGPIAASPGIAIGPAFRLQGAVLPPVPDAEPGEPDEQWQRLRTAIGAAQGDIAETRARVSRESGEDEAAIFDAHLMLLDDAALLDDVRARIRAGGGAAGSWHDAITQVARAFDALDDPYLAVRAADVRSVGEQVLRHLLRGEARVPGAGILVAADLGPVDAAEVDAGRVLGIVLAYGSSTSHAAILAGAKGIPMLVAAGRDVLAIEDGTRLVVDADRGALVIDPSGEVRRDYEMQAADHTEAYAQAHAAAAHPAVTADGRSVPVYANVGSVDDAKAAADAYADGAGLVRTEFLFRSRSEPPTVDEQVAVYRAIADALPGRHVVFRTLDAGGDKPLPFAPMAPEANPFLGVRGIRLSLRERDLLRAQLQAICAVAANAPVGVMFPMVSGLDELRAAAEVLDEACGGRRPDGLRVGIMVEVPAVALKAASFAGQVDFFSAGTNDLTQYALAAERGNSALAALADPLDPGVLSLVAALCRHAGRAVVSVCGAIAADPVAVPLLLGLGVNALSVPPPAVAAVKQAIRAVDTSQAADLALRALQCASAAAVRTLATSG